MLKEAVNRVWLREIYIMPMDFPSVILKGSRELTIPQALSVRYSSAGILYAGRLIKTRGFSSSSSFQFKQKIPEPTGSGPPLLL